MKTLVNKTTEKKPLIRYNGRVYYVNYAKRQLIAKEHNEIINFDDLPKKVKFWLFS